MVLGIFDLLFEQDVDFLEPVLHELESVSLISNVD